MGPTSIRADTFACRTRYFMGWQRGRVKAWKQDDKNVQATESLYVRLPCLFLAYPDSQASQILYINRNCHKVQIIPVEDAGIPIYPKESTLFVVALSTDIGVIKNPVACAR